MKILFKRIITFIFLSFILIPSAEAGFLNSLAGKVAEPFYANPDRIFFEIWNKTKSDIIFCLSKHISHARGCTGEPGKTETTLTERVSPGHLAFFDDNEFRFSGFTYLYVFTPDKTFAKIYEFSGEKKILVRLKETRKGKYIFGPQTGPLKGLNGKTDTGISLDDNVRQSDITEIPEKLKGEKRAQTMIGMARRKEADVPQVVKTEEDLMADDVDKLLGLEGREATTDGWRWKPKSKKSRYVANTEAFVARVIENDEPYLYGASDDEEEPLDN
jgi:hypothetical protein